MMMNEMQRVALSCPGLFTLARFCTLPTLVGGKKTRTKDLTISLRIDPLIVKRPPCLNNEDESPGVHFFPLAKWWDFCVHEHKRNQSINSSPSQSINSDLDARVYVRIKFHVQFALTCLITQKSWILEKQLFSGPKRGWWPFQRLILPRLVPTR